MTAAPAEPEKAALLRALDAAREHVLDILDRLSDAQLRRVVLPSGWTCAGLVQHLALDIERFWFQVVFAGTAEELDVDAWQVDPGEPAADALQRYRAEMARADEIISAARLDQPPGNWPAERWGSWRLADLRALLLHVLGETAVHAGHLDAARELMDGRQWLVLGS